MTATTSPRQRHGARVLEITGGGGGISLAELSELWEFREVLMAFAQRKVKVRYKQAIIGISWAVIQPAFSAVLFSVVLGRLAHVPSEGAPYILFALAGMVAWTYFSTSSGQAIDSFITDGAMIRKVYFPREILPLSSLLAGTVDLLPGLAVLAVLAATMGVLPSVWWLFLPLPLLLLLVTAAALSLGLSALNAYYRDVRYGMSFIFQIGLFASPVVYPLGLVPHQWRTLYAVINPVAESIDAIRRIVVHQSAPDFWLLGLSFVWAVLLLALSYAAFKRLERGISDRI